MIKILGVGKKHEAWVQSGISRYETRLRRPFNVEWSLVPHSHKGGQGAREDESQRLLTRAHAGEFVILLDEKGTLIDSPALSRLLLTPLQTARNVVVIIGGAYGVDETVHARADFTWSLSPLVFPHQMVRLLLSEQLYRAQEIATGNPYHHT